MENNVVVTTAFDHFAFGLVMDTREQVYIPASIVQKFDLHEMDVITAILAPNKGERVERTPWFAVYVTKHNGVDALAQAVQETEQEEEPIKQNAPQMTRSEAVQHILSDGSIYSTAKVAEIMSKITGVEISAANANYHLETLHQDGEVACAEISQSGDAKVGRRYWAKNTTSFTKAFNGGE